MKRFVRENNSPTGIRIKIYDENADPTDMFYPAKLYTKVVHIHSYFVLLGFPHAVGFCGNVGVTEDISRCSCKTALFFASNLPKSCAATSALR